MYLCAASHLVPKLDKNDAIEEARGLCQDVSTGKRVLLVQTVASPVPARDPEAKR